MESPAVRGVYALTRRHLFSWLGVSTMTISPACLWVQQSKPHKWPTIRQQTHRGNKTARQSYFSTEALEQRKWRGKRSFRQPCVPFLMCPVLNWWPLLESLYVIIKCNGWITILRMGNMAHMEHWEGLMCFLHTAPLCLMVKINQRIYSLVLNLWLVSLVTLCIDCCGSKSNFMICALYSYTSILKYYSNSDAWYVKNNHLVLLTGSNDSLKTKIRLGCFSHKQNKCFLINKTKKVIQEFGGR